MRLRFEIAPPRVVHPNRTDIACFVGTVARRAVPRPPRTMPAVIERWLADLGFSRLNGVPVGALAVDLESRARFAAGLLAQAAEEREALGAALAASPEALGALLAACRSLSPLPAALLDDLAERGYLPRRLLGPDELAGWLRIQRLGNLPIAVETFEEFDRLFAWEQRPVLDRALRPGDPTVTTALGVAVRAFFSEGGRRCWIVRTGNPSAAFAPPRERFAACFPQPDMRAGDADAPTAVDRDDDRCAQLTGVARLVRRGLVVSVHAEALPISSEPGAWQGLEHAYGLPEVSFACLPDLIDACAQGAPTLAAPAPAAAAPEGFHDCVEEMPPERAPVGRRLPAPTLSTFGMENWRSLLVRALGLLGNGGRAHHRRDVQLLASLPLSGEGRDLPSGDDWLEWMTREGWFEDDEGARRSLVSERLQLAYPWLRTREAGDCQGGIEAPEGTLAGVLARGALQRGAFRSIAGQPVARFLAAQPALDWARATERQAITPVGPVALADRVCLIGPAPSGPQILSDVTGSARAETRQGAVRRLVNVVMQAARIAGEEFAFEPNGEALWSRLRERLEDLGRVLLGAGALSTDGVPFSVRCGRETMTQADIDAGRLIAVVELLAAQPIQRIVVVLAMRDAQPRVELRAA